MSKTTGGLDALDSMTTQVGALNALRTGNMLIDMLVAMCLPLVFGTLAGLVHNIVPGAKKVHEYFRARTTQSPSSSTLRRVR